MSKREAILSAGQNLFARFGPRKTTVEDIVRMARIAKSTFYQHFSDKEALFREIVRMEATSLVEVTRAAVARGGSARERMKAYFTARAGRLRELAILYQVTYETVDEYWPQITEVRERHFLEEQGIIRDILAEGMDQGELDIEDVEQTAYIIVMAVRGLEMPWMLAASRVDLESGIETILNGLFAGMQVK